MKKLIFSSAAIAASLFVLACASNARADGSALAEGLRAYHKLSDANDFYLNGYNLINNNAAAFATGTIGNAVDFGSSNTDKYLSTTSTLGLTAGGSMTWAGWVKITGSVTPASGVRYGIFSIGAAGSPNINYHAHYGNIGGVTALRFDREGQNVAHHYATYTATLTQNQWYFMVFTFDGTTMTVYVDGVSRATNTSLGNGASNSTNDHYFLGALEDSGTTTASSSAYGSLAIDEAGAWSRSLTASEVSELYNGGSGVIVTMPPTTDLRAYHKLSDTNDFYSNGYNLARSGPSFGAAKIGDGVDFGSANASGYLSTSSTLGLTGGGNLSWAGWVKISSTPANDTRQGIFSVGKAGSPNVNYHGHYSTLSGVTALRFDRERQNVAHDYTTYATTLTPGQWYFLAFTYDGTIAKIYVDNVLQATSTPSGSGGANSTNDHYFLGALEDSGTTTTSASAFGSLAIDEAGVWGRALSAGEISGLYNSGNGLAMFSVTGLRAYHRLSDADDDYSNGYNLTNNNSSTFASAKVGDGVDFGSSNSSKYLSTSSTLGLTGGGSVSWTGWVKVTATPADSTRQGIFSIGKGGSPNINYHAHYSTIGGVTALRFDRERQNVAHDYTTYVTTLTTGQWYFLAVTYDGTTAKMYLDSVLRATSTPSGSGASNSTNDHYYLGALEDSGTTTSSPSSYGSLAIDEAGVWARALSATEVSILYSDGNGLADLRAYHNLSDTNESYLNGYNLTTNGLPVFSAAKIGSGVDFGTANVATYLSSSSTLGLTGGGSLSWAGWVKVSGTPANGTRQGIFSVGKAGSPNVNYHAHYSTLSGTPALRFDREKQNSAHEYTTYATTLSTGQWYFLAFTYDGTTAKIYVDSVLQATSTPSGNGAANSTNDHYFLGALEDSGTTSASPSAFGSLAIDESGIWARALSSTEVSDLYNGGDGTSFITLN